ncbi:hypothetical protein [Streptomyces chartreusis]|uniref:hypothetical protein n=1 Tax=Streptomyces chartreusis TaxID=1969 RepID=UPI0036660FB0
MSAPAAGQPTAYVPLRGPDDNPLVSLDLTTEIRLAHELLDRVEADNIHDKGAMIRAAVALMMRLRSLAEAAERGVRQ